MKTDTTVSTLTGHSESATGFAASTLLLTLCATCLIEGFVWMAGGVIGPFIFPTAVIISALTSTLLQRPLSLPVAAKGTAIAVVLIAVSVALSSLIEDNSYDGNFYHQEEVVTLAEGWNPVKEISPEGHNLQLWTIHYAKAMEMIAAAIVSTTGNLESGKGVNLILILASALFVFSFLKRVAPSIGNAQRWAICFIAVANPVCVAQATTFYNDFTKYYYFILTAIFLYEIWFRPTSRSLLYLGCTTLLAVGTKFNIFFDQGTFIAAGMIWFFIKKRPRPAFMIAGVALTAVAIGLLLPFYHPYITNMVNFGNPFYPLMGNPEIDIMTNNTPEIYTSHNRFVNFFISLFSFSIPTYDSRIGGFTVMMPLLLIVSAWVFWRYRREIPAAAVYTAAMAFVSCFFFEQSWWARYICQLWGVPVIATVSLFLIKNERKAVIARRLMIALATVAFFATAVPSAARIYLHNVRRSFIYSVPDGTEVKVYNSMRHTDRHLREHGLIPVETESLDSLDLTRTVFFYGSHKILDNPLVELPPADYDRLVEESPRFHINYTTMKAVADEPDRNINRMADE